MFEIVEELPTRRLVARPPMIGNRKTRTAISRLKKKKKKYYYPNEKDELPPHYNGLGVMGQFG